ncbi:MAG: oxidoreductase [Proteobacteria bacterium SG_bin9]|nr:MAG: oxidoreductase [Proteobacteria bacterium SG_bin9]
MTITAQSKTTASTFTSQSLRLDAKAVDAEAIELKRSSQTIQRGGSGDVVVEIKAAAVNPSDVKAAIGMMPYAVFPRTPGRDFAGVVVDGPSQLLGREVFGSSGDLGIRRDGTHASHLVVEADAVVPKPARVSMEEAAGIGVPFVTAMEGLRRAGMPKSGETVLILGLNGKVGQAAAQIARWKGARVIGAMRKLTDEHRGFADDVIDSGKDDVAARVRELTNGRGADVVFNTVGEPYYEAGQKSLAVLGRMIFIAAFKQTVPFDIFAFYRGRHTYVGIDTLALSSIATADVLRDMTEGFESGFLKPFPILPTAIYPLARAHEAYVRVLGSSPDRLVLAPSK